MRVKILRKIVVVLILTILLFEDTQAHPWKPDHYVVIDTDCGLDDFRAINLLLASPHVRVLAIITSPGVLNAKDGYTKVASLLNSYHHEGIPVGINSTETYKAKNCKPALVFGWGGNIQAEGIEYCLYTDVINQVLENHNDKITFISLGSLNTVARCLKNCPQFSQKVNEILWAGNYKDLKNSFNYILDIASYDKIINSEMNFSILNGEIEPDYDGEFIQKIKNINTQYAKQFHRSLKIPDNSYALKLYDEMVSVFFEDENLFTCDTISYKLKNYRFRNDMNRLEKSLLAMLTNDIENQNQVLSIFPLDTADYMTDIQEIISPTIKKYGKEEWISCVLTSELHRHLGVYSLIGTKMGIRAREYFGAGVDEMGIVSYAGHVPPFSCLNDGLQVSTGATVGHGLITVKDSLKLPMADFNYLGRKITISLKDEYREKIASEIKELNFIYGLDSEIYWDLVRGLAIKYWRYWDRHEIFEIKK